MNRRSFFSAAAVAPALAGEPSAPRLKEPHADPLCPRVPIKIDGETLYLACTLRALYSFEKAAGRSISAIGGMLTTETALTLLWALLVTEHPGIEQMDVGAARGNEFRDAIDAALKLIVEMQPKPKPGKATAPAKAAAAIDWRYLWSSARIEMGLTDDEFWNLAPWQLVEMQDRLQDARDQFYFGHSMVCAAVTNVHIDPEKAPPYQPAFFMPGPIGEEARGAVEKQQQTGLKGKLPDFAAAFGRVTKRKT